MSKLKKLSEKAERYNVVVDATSTANPETPFGARATVSILNDSGVPTRQVVGQCYGAKTLDEASEEALCKAVCRVLGEKDTKKLVEKYPAFNLSVDAMATGKKELPIGAKAVVTAYDDKGKVIRSGQGVAMGTDPVEVEKKALKAAINRALGV